MGCCGSKPLEDDEKAPLLGKTKGGAPPHLGSIQVPPPDSLPSPVFSPTSRHSNSSIKPQKTLSRESSVSSFADYDVLKRMRAIYTYTPSYDDELAFKEGDLIEITNMDNPNWYFGRLDGKKGLVPTNYLREEVQVERGDVQVYSPTADSPQVSKEELRLQQIHKLITSQDEFSAELDKFIQGFITPLSKARAFSDAEFRAIFSNINELRDKNTEILTALKDLETSENIDMVGECLLQKLALFNSFIPFCVNYPDGLINLRTQLSKNPVSQIYQVFTHGQPGVLEKYYAKPYQHIVRFPLSIQKILDATPEYHLDHENLVKVFEYVDKIKNSVNEETNRILDAKRLRQIQEKLDIEMKKNHIHLFGLGDRQLLREGSVTEMKDSQALRAFLFDDLILFLYPSSEKKRKHSIYKIIPLLNLKMALTEPVESFAAIKKFMQNNNVLPVPEKAKQNGIIEIYYGDDGQFIEIQAPVSVETGAWAAAINQAGTLFEGREREEFNFTRLMEGARLKNLREVHQTSSGDLFLLIGSELDFAVQGSSENELNAIGVSSDVVQFTVVESLDKIFVLHASAPGIPGTLSVYSLRTIHEGLQEPLKDFQFNHSTGTTSFAIGKIGEVFALVSFAPKLMTIFQADENLEFFKVGEIPLPRGTEGNEKRVFFSAHGCFIGLGNRFYLLSDSPQMKEVGDQSGQSEAVGCLDFENTPLLVDEGKGAFVDENGQILHGRVLMPWISPAISCARVQESYIGVFTKGAVEIWDPSSGNFLHMISGQSKIKPIKGNKGFGLVSETLPSLVCLSDFPVATCPGF